VAVSVTFFSRIERIQKHAGVEGARAGHQRRISVR
jgi:hypothetical protein